MAKRNRNQYPIFDIVLPSDISDSIDGAFGSETKLNTYRVCAYLIFRIGMDDKLHEVSSTYLRKIIPTYKEYLGRLIFEGIVITDNKYVCSISNDWAGVSKCKAFRLNSKFTDFKTVTIAYPKIIDAPEGKSPVESECKDDSKVTKIASRNLKRFCIDSEKAIAYLCKRQGGKVPKKSPLEPLEALAAFTGIMRIRNGYHYAKSCNYGRIHTNFTCLDSNIKMGCVSHVSGAPLVHIDIRNSQPSILRAVLMDRMDMNDPKMKAEIEMYTKFCRADLYEALYLINFSVDNVETAYAKPDTQEIFETAFKKELTEKSNRKTAKGEFIKMLFDKDSTGLKKGSRNLKMYEKFQKIFPLIYAEIKLIKKNHYENLAHELQRFESRRILHPLIRFLDKEKIDFLSIHDSVIVPMHHLETVKNEFNRILQDNNVESILEIESLKG